MKIADPKAFNSHSQNSEISRISSLMEYQGPRQVLKLKVVSTCWISLNSFFILIFYLKSNYKENTILKEVNNYVTQKFCSFCTIFTINECAKWTYNVHYYRIYKEHRNLGIRKHVTTSYSGTKPFY